jgi:hypothetical protein
MSSTVSTHLIADVTAWSAAGVGQLTLNVQVETAAWGGCPFDAQWGLQGYRSPGSKLRAGGSASKLRRAGRLCRWQPPRHDRRAIAARIATSAPRNSRRLRGARSDQVRHGEQDLELTLERRVRPLPTSEEAVEARTEVPDSGGCARAWVGWPALPSARVVPFPGGDLGCQGGTPAEAGERASAHFSFLEIRKVGTRSRLRLALTDEGDQRT